MKNLFYLVEFATETTHNENNGMGLFEALKDKPEALKLICQAIYEAKAHYDYIKKFF